MSKVIVIDCCWGCMYFHPVVDWMGKCEKMDKGVGNPKERIPDWCPLPDLPERKEEMEYLAVGYNKCLDDILEG